MQRRIRIFFLFIFFFLIAAHVTFQSSRKVQNPNIAERFIVFLYTPVAHFIDGTGESIRNTVDDYLMIVHKSAENRRLKEMLHLVKLENVSLKEQLNQSLEDEKLQRQFEYLGRRLKRTTILGHDPFAQSKTLWIEGGRDIGIQVNSPVIAADGLVGKVIEVFDKTSKVLLLVDPFFSVDVLNDRTKLRCLIKGMRSEEVVATRLPFLSQVEYFQEGHDMRSDDTLVTSGQSGIYPAGIPVGKIVSLDDLQHFDKATVLPAVDFMKLDRVYILVSKTDDVTKSEGAKSKEKSEKKKTKKRGKKEAS